MTAILNFRIFAKNGKTLPLKMAAILNFRIFAILNFRIFAQNGKTQNCFYLLNRVR